MRGAPRTVLSDSTRDFESGALSGRSGTQAWRFGGKQTLGAMASTRTMALQLRSVLAGADGPARQTERDPTDDRAAREHGYSRLDKALELALELGSSDAAAVRHLLSRDQLDRTIPPRLELTSLIAYERPLPEVNNYDQLLGSEVR